MKKSLTPYYWIFTVGMIILLICPSLIQDGMFMDGQQYACVSMNLADGYGTWWFPYLSDTWWKAGSGNFMEHPPLVYWIQAGFFKVLGDSMYVERLYSFLTALITAFLIHRIWWFVFRDLPQMQKLSWLPVLCWIIIPVGFWSYQHNIQENTMAIFTLLAVYFFMLSTDAKKPVYLWLILAGISTALAFLSKGPPGLFPMVVVGIYWLTYRSISIWRMLVYSFVIAGTVLSFYALILLSDAAYESLSYYINERLLYRIDNEPVVSNRFSILVRLLMELLPSLGLAVMIIIVAYLKKKKPEKFFPYKKEVLFFLLVGLSASLPLMLTPVQRGFYLLPSFPFFALGIAAIAGPYYVLLIQNRSLPWTVIVRSLAALILVTGVTLTVLNVGNARRDKEMLEDVHLIGQHLPDRITVGAEQAIFDQWNFKFYLMRYCKISVSMDRTHEYILIQSGSTFPEIEQYNKVGLNTQLYDLYQIRQQIN
ncbi:MAG: glycosyltransferase family 39 protein [Crocinitomicaceae bacterium]|nr:glycosyltransferase family 39 protein [Crocinitomicaceae bacterium]